MKYMTRKCLFLIMTVLLAMSFTLTASAAKSSIELKETKITLTEGKTVKLKATVKGKKNKITWKSSKPKVASVDSKGNITAKKAGKAVIRAKANGKTAKCTVIVKKADYRDLYLELLEQERIYAGDIKVTPEYFLVLDIDKKKMPELIAANVSGNYCSYYVFTVKNGKAVFAGSCSMKTDQMPVLNYYSKQKAIGTSGGIDDGSWKAMFSLEKNKLKMKRYAYEGAVKAGSEKMEYRIDPKRSSVTKKKYKEYVQKYFSGNRVYEMHVNSAENRKIILAGK